MIKIAHVLAAILLCATAAGAQQPSAVNGDAGQSNKAAVEESFRQWQEGEGSPFTLLSEDMRWTIAGSSPFAGTYDHGPFVSDVIEPFTRRITVPLKPTRWEVYEDGDVVIIHFDAEALLITGEQYRNSYAWFFTFREGEVAEVTAFLDMPAFEAVMAIE